MSRWVVVGLLMVAVGLAALGNSTVTFRDGPATAAKPHAWQVIGEYMMGERLLAEQKVWIQVNDPDLVAGDTPWVELYNPATGDRVNHQLGAAAAGVSRSVSPVILAGATGSPNLTDQRLEVYPGDTIYVYYTDPRNPSDTSVATARAVWGEVQLYEGAATLPNLRGTFRGPGAIGAALGRAVAVAAAPPDPALPVMQAPRIVVQPGTYTEDVNINPAAGWPNGLVLEAGGPGVRLVNATAGTAVVRVQQSGITVRGFEIYPTAVAVPSHGVHVIGDRSGIRIENNTIVNPAGANGVLANQSRGIYVQNNISTIVIVGNTVLGGMNGPQHGISFRENVTDALISGNLIEGCQQHGIWFENAGGARIFESIRIEANTIRNNWGARPANQGVGIRFGDRLPAPGVDAQVTRLSNLQIVGNTIHGNEHGIEILLNGAAGHIFRDLTISQNTVFGHNDTTGGAPIKAGLRVAAEAAGVLPVNFTVTGNEFYGNEVGVLLDQGTQAGFQARQVQVLGNRIVHNRVGVQVLHQNNQINNNDIVGNEQWGVHAQGIGGAPTNMVDARNNWWGHSSGPRHFTRNPGGQGNPVTDHVNFQPFLGSTVAPDAMIDVRDAQILPAGAGFVSIWFTGRSDLAELQVGQVGEGSALTFSQPAKVDVTSVEGVDPYEVLAWDYDDVGGRLTFTVSLKGGGTPRAGEIARLAIQASGTHGDTVQMTLGPVPLDKCVDVGGNPIVHGVDDGVLTLTDAAPPAQLKGDVNNDGVVDITDARWAAEAAIGMRTLTAAQFAAADVAPPFGVVDITDARWIAEAAVGLRTLALPMPGVPAPGGAVAVRLGAGVLQITGAQVSDVQGRILYNPATVSITGLSGVNGFEVLAWRDDPTAGVVVFAATRLHGGASGGILQVQSRGDASALSVLVDILRGPDGGDIPFGTTGVATLLSVGNAPNPVTDVHTTFFHVKASAPVEEIRVWLYDLAGRLVWDSGWALNGLAWHLDDLRGQAVANGVYFYTVQAKLEGLAGIVTSSAQKLVVLR